MSSNHDGNGARPPAPPDRSPEEIFPFFRRRDMPLPEVVMKVCEGRVTTALEFFQDLITTNGPAAKHIDDGCEPYLAIKADFFHEMPPWLHVDDVGDRLTAEGRVILFVNVFDALRVYQDTLIFWRRR